MQGAVIGAASGAASGAALGAVGHRLSTGSWKGAGKAALNGAADGYMWGAATGFITGGVTSKACFVAGTSILTAGGHVAIETIKSGDMVWAENPETGEKALKKVVQTYVKESSELIHVKVDGQEIVCTNEHPFYVPQKGWTAAEDLRAGDILVLQNGKYVTIEQVQHEILEQPVMVYNFEVEDFHTYYVGNCSVLVHNDCGGLKIGKPSKGVKRIRNDSAKVNSQEFIDFIRGQGKSFKSNEWTYKMETWLTEDGNTIERHYWLNKKTGESYYHL